MDKQTKNKHPELLAGFVLEALDRKSGLLQHIYRDPRKHGEEIYHWSIKGVLADHVQIYLTKVEVITLCEVELFGDNKCEHQYFGLECNRICNCRNVKDSCMPSTGACPSGCAVGYKGEDCSLKVPCDPPPIITNGHWSSCLHEFEGVCLMLCNTGYKVQDISSFDGCMEDWYGPHCLYKAENCSEANNIQMKFIDELYFKSVMIRFQEKSTLVNVTVSLKSLDGIIIKCEKILTYWIDSFTMGIDCVKDRFVTEININFTSFVSVCQVRLNGGRNVIKESRIEIHSNGLRIPLNNTDLLGVFDNEEEDIDCFTIIKPGQEIIWESNFDWPRVIFQILIFTTGNLNTSMHKFKVELYNDEHELVFAAAIDKFSIPYTLNIERIEMITKIVLIASEIMALCELQAFGDCTNRRYGINCNHICMTTCKNQECQFTGVCKLCVPGRSGDYCLYSNTTHKLPNNTDENFKIQPLFYSEQQTSSLSWEELFVIILVFMLCLIALMLILSSRTSNPRLNFTQE
ncbi:uncharacterized protein LOC131940224 [Physella acuta]|uniref:uncharacterized protein LOC131940224 n=1 Tax=Physella acuta TaxID=109671 RepID=UPI0027DB01BC|nr:uncharacterized protein LOC131940224 [Physella acuta]